MKFGKLLAAHLSDCDAHNWPCVRYKMLKSELKTQMPCAPQLAATSAFKLALLSDSQYRLEPLGSTVATD